MIQTVYYREKNEDATVKKLELEFEVLKVHLNSIPRL